MKVLSQHVTVFIHRSSCRGDEVNGRQGRRNLRTADVQVKVKVSGV